MRTLFREDGNAVKYVMSYADEAIHAAICEAELLRKEEGKQVRGSEPPILRIQCGLPRICIIIPA